MTHIYQFISVIFFSVFFVQALVRHNRKQQCYHFSTEFYVAAANSLPISPASQPAVSRRHTIFEIRHYNRQINNTYAHHSIGLFLTTMVLVMTTALIGPMQKKNRLRIPFLSELFFFFGKRKLFDCTCVSGEMTHKRSRATYVSTEHSTEEHFFSASNFGMINISPFFRLDFWIGIFNIRIRINDVVHEVISNRKLAFSICIQDVVHEIIVVLLILRHSSGKTNAKHR